MTETFADGILTAVMSMVKYVQGVYKDGRIELEHPPESIEEARVIVAFLTDADGQQPSPKEVEAAVAEQMSAVAPTRRATVTVSPAIAERAAARRGKPHPFRPIDPFQELWLKALAEASEGQEDE